MKRERFPGGPQGDEFAFREKDLKGHIKSPKELESEEQEEDAPHERRPMRRPPKQDEAGQDLPLKREFGDMTRDNQLKSAYDMLRSWDLFHKRARQG
jgi:hypothetical protein